MATVYLSNGDAGGSAQQSDTTGWVPTGVTATLEGWFRGTWGPNGGFLFGISGTLTGLWLHLSSTGGLTLAYGAGGAVVTLIATGITVADGAWHHLAGVKDDGQDRLYFDGVEVASATRTSGTVIQPGTRAFGLWHSSTADQGLTGDLQEVRLWNVARTQSQIAALMGQWATAGTSGLAAAWPLTEGTGALAYDVVASRALVLSGPKWQAAGLPPIAGNPAAPVALDTSTVSDALSSWLDVTGASAHSGSLPLLNYGLLNTITGILGTIPTAGAAIASAVNTLLSRWTQTNVDKTTQAADAVLTWQAGIVPTGLIATATDASNIRDDLGVVTVTGREPLFDHIDAALVANEDFQNTKADEINAHTDAALGAWSPTISIDYTRLTDHMDVAAAAVETRDSENAGTLAGIIADSVTALETYIAAHEPSATVDYDRITTAMSGLISTAQTTIIAAINGIHPTATVDTSAIITPINAHTDSALAGLSITATMDYDTVQARVAAALAAATNLSVNLGPVLDQLNATVGTTAQWGSRTDWRTVWAALAALVAVLSNLSNVANNIRNLFPAGHEPEDVWTSLQAHRVETEPIGPDYPLPTFIADQLDALKAALPGVPNTIPAAALTLVYDQIHHGGEWVQHDWYMARVDLSGPNLWLGDATPIGQRVIRGGFYTITAADGERREGRHMIYDHQELRPYQVPAGGLYLDTDPLNTVRVRLYTP